MEDHITIVGLKPYDGRYPIDLLAGSFTTREWGWIKRFAGYHPVDYLAGLTKGDVELYVVLALVAMCRAEKIRWREVEDLYERFQDADPAEKLEIDIAERTADEAGDADSPPQEKPSVNGSSSGAAGTTSSETSTSTLPDTGDPDSGFSEFDLIRSGS